MSEILTSDLQSYYTFQSKIYDWTRWSFLFGRRQAINLIPFAEHEKFTIAEIGCGTGFNLEKILAKYSFAKVIGFDLSQDMLEICRKKTTHYGSRIKLINEAYDHHTSILSGKVDIILFSYALTMINPGWDELIVKAHKDLKKGGKIIVADFHQGRSFFQKHMSNHHVRMDGHILKRLQEIFPNNTYKVQSVYMGVWQYLVFSGEK